MAKSIDFKLDGEWTKLLKAFAELFGLQYTLECSFQEYSPCPSLDIDVWVKTEYYDSVLFVFEYGKVAYVSSMREWKPNPSEDDVENLSKKILEGTFGDGRYIRSMKGGDCVRLIGNGQYEPVPRFEIHDLPKSIEELKIRLDIECIDYNNIEVKMENKHGN